MVIALTGVHRSQDSGDNNLLMVMLIMIITMIMMMVIILTEVHRSQDSADNNLDSSPHSQSLGERIGGFCILQFVYLRTYVGKGP